MLFYVRSVIYPRNQGVAGSSPVSSSMEKYCLNCNKKIEHARTITKFCSNTCQREYEYKTYIKNWKDGKVDGLKGYSLSSFIKRYILEKNNYCCEVCGCNYVNPFTNKTILEVHHIDGDYTNNREENLQLLCPNHHAMTENYKNNNKLGRTKRKTNSEGNASPNKLEK